MTESMIFDAATKLGAAAFLGVLLYVVLIRVGAAIVAAQDRVADAVREHTTAVTANTAAVTRVEAKLDHQLAIDRDRDRKLRREALRPGTLRTGEVQHVEAPAGESDDGGGR